MSPVRPLKRYSSSSCLTSGSGYSHKNNVMSASDIMIRLQNGDDRERIGLRNKLSELIEDKAVHLDYDQQKIDVPPSVRSTFLMVFSPDGSRVASTHGDHKIYISQVATGRVIQTLEGHPRTPWCLAFHPTLKDVIASGCLAGEVRVWDLRSPEKPGCEVWVNSHGGVIASLAFHPTDHVILIATLNELHFWDWRQSNVPFLTLATSSDKEKVRYVKFDSMGTKIITGISNLPPVRSGPSPLHAAVSSAAAVTFSPISRVTLEPNSYSSGLNHLMVVDVDVPPPLTGPTISQNNNNNSTPSSSLRRSSLINRVMTMYRHIESPTADDGNNGNSASGSSSPSSSGNNSSSSAAAAATAPWMFVNPLRGVMSHEPLPPIIEPIDPNAAPNVATSSDDGSRVASGGGGGGGGGPSSPPTSSQIMNPAIDYSNSLMNTFRRLHSLCTRLAQLMQEQQNSSRLIEGSRDVRSTEASASLNDLLSRLQQSLQNMSTAALTTAIAQEHIQQVRQRVAEILERLENVSGYRQRLASLRDQIYEVAERIAAGSEPELGGSQRWDLIHCLWLVDMSIHLTRQMQRILAADYRLTQITLNNAQGSSGGGSSGSSSGGSTIREPDIVTESNRPSPDDDWRPPPTSLTLGPSTLRAVSRGRYHPYTYTRWMLRNRTPNSSSSSDGGSGGASSSSSSSSSSDPGASGPFSIPSVRISGPPPDDLMSPSSGDEGMAPEHVFIRESVAPGAASSSSPSPSSSQNRPRSPPLPEIQSVILGSSSAASASSSSPLLMSERFNIVGVGDRGPPGARGSSNGGSHSIPPHHIWFSGAPVGHAANASWHMSAASSEFFGHVGLGITTYRLQSWDFSRFTLPNLKDAQMNLVVSKCRIHNDASVDVNPDGTLLASLVPIENSHSVNLCIYSLEKDSFAQCLYIWTFGGNAVSVSLSPLSRYVVVGLTSPRAPPVYLYPPSSDNVTIGQVFQLSDGRKNYPNPIQPNLEHVRNIDVSRTGSEPNSSLLNNNSSNNESFSLNSMRWMPNPGEGFIYGTNRGHLVICRPEFFSCINDGKSGFHLKATWSSSSSSSSHHHSSSGPVASSSSSSNPAAPPLLHTPPLNPNSSNIRSATTGTQTLFLTPIQSTSSVSGIRLSDNSNNPLVVPLQTSSIGTQTVNMNE